jgi:carbonic anhydrase
MIDTLLEGNQRFIEKDFKPHRDHYQKIARGQSPKVLWIGCSDSRVNPERITCARAGEIFVHRNIGNIVPNNDWSFATVLEYAVQHLKVSEIVICGHGDCGAMKALDAESSDAYIPLWLNNARQAKKAVDAGEKTLGPQDRKRRIELENIRLQMEHLRTYPIVQRAEKEGRIALHGLYYDPETGKLAKVL